MLDNIDFRVIPAEARQGVKSEQYTLPAQKGLELARLDFTCDIEDDGSLVWDSDLSAWGAEDIEFWSLGDNPLETLAIIIEQYLRAGLTTVYESDITIQDPAFKAWLNMCDPGWADKSKSVESIFIYYDHAKYVYKKLCELVVKINEAHLICRLLDQYYPYNYDRHDWAAVSGIYF